MLTLILQWRKTFFSTSDSISSAGSANLEIHDDWMCTSDSAMIDLAPDIDTSEDLSNAYDHDQVCRTACTAQCRFLITSLRLLYTVLFRKVAPVK